MRLIISILITIVASNVFGQENDTRAELGIIGRINEISVSPDEKIWITTAIGKTFYTENMNSTWSYGQSFTDASSFLSMRNPYLERISFFNKDTAIMTGFIDGTGKEHRKGGYYYTSDAGQNWEKKEFGGSSWIYDVFIGKQGKAWMGGSSGEIFYTEDHGINWIKLNSPYDSSSRMLSIFMLNEKEGISGALQPEIYQTSDNWQSCTKIRSPYEAGKYQGDQSVSIHRIEKVIFWKNFIVVNQNGNIFYSKKNKINWKQFKLNIVDFELDQDSQLLYAITEDQRLISFDSPTRYNYLTEEFLKKAPIDFTFVNESLFVLDRDKEIYKVNANQVKSLPLYTTEKKISKPRNVKQLNGKSWGINGHHLYLSDNNGEDWYREKKFDFYIADINLLSDSTAILWDGVKANYFYSLKNHSEKAIMLDNPIMNFFDAPIEKLIISAESKGCYHGDVDEMVYTSKDKFSLEVEKVVVKSDSNSTTFHKSLDVSQFNEILFQINDKPSHIPSIEDFNITKKDKIKYLELVDKRANGKPSHWNDDAEKEIDKKFYYKIVKRLDKLDEGVIEKVLTQRENTHSTTSHHFVIQIKNENDAIINVRRNYFHNSRPYHFPWIVEFEGQHFACYNVKFSKYINDSLPDKFMSKGVFDNGFLIMAIADYLYDVEKK